MAYLADRMKIKEIEKSITIEVSWQKVPILIK